MQSIFCDNQKACNIKHNIQYYFIIINPYINKANKKKKKKKTDKKILFQNDITFTCIYKRSDAFTCYILQYNPSQHGMRQHMASRVHLVATKR